MAFGYLSIRKYYVDYIADDKHNIIHSQPQSLFICRPFNVVAMLQYINFVIIININSLHLDLFVTFCS